MDKFINYISLVSNVYGITQSGILLALAGYGISWTSHKIMNSIINTQQLQSYSDYNWFSKMIIGLMNAGTETIVFAFSFSLALKGLWSLVFTPLSLYLLCMVIITMNKIDLFYFYSLSNSKTGSDNDFDSKIKTSS